MATGIKYHVYMTSSNGNIFRVTGPLWGEFTGPQCISITKASGGLCLFSLIFAWTNGGANNQDAGDLGRHHADYGVTVIRL